MRKALCPATVVAILAVAPLGGHAQDVSRNIAARPLSPTCTTGIELPEQVVDRRVLPAPDMVSLIVRAPIAWTRSMGGGVRVAIVGDGDPSLVTAIAPAASVEVVRVDQDARVEGVPLAQVLAQRGFDVVALPRHGVCRPAALVAAVTDTVASGIPVLASADHESGSDQWVEDALVPDLRAAGAINVASVDLAGRACGFLFPMDVFAPAAVGAGGGTLAAAGIAALVLSASPGLCPATLRQHLTDTADSMYQGTDTGTCQWYRTNVVVDPVTGDYRPAPGAFTFRRVNAARALRLTLQERWPLNAIEAPEAWKATTGRGVAVAVVDQGFHVSNPVFAGHLIDTKAFYPGTFDPPQNFHGTSMAKIVLAVAPDVSLMFLNHGERTDMPDAKAHAFSQCVDYAVARGAKVMTSSAAPWPNTPEVWAAIDRAVAAGVTVVWIHYQGPNEAVIRPRYVWLQGDVGAFDRFFDDDKPSDLEGGLSDTSPQIAGIAALMLQLEPGLPPLEVKRRIMATATPLAGCVGCTIADAEAAVANRQPGSHRIRRHLP